MDKSAPEHSAAPECASAVSRRRLLGIFIDFSLAAGLSAYAFREVFLKKGDTGGEPIKRRKTLGSTGLEVSPIALGVGSSMLSPAVFRAAFGSGINTLETARVYGMGKGEEHIGQMIKGIARDRLVIITKFGCLRQHNPLNESCAAQVEKSLRALKTEYIDVLLIHGLSVDDARFLRDDAIRSALADLKRSGKIRFCGASVHGDPTEILSIMLEDRFFDVAMIPFSYYTGRGIIDALGRARRSGIGIITMKSYLLTRRIRKTRLEPLVLRYILSRPFVDTTALRIDYVETLERYLSALRAPYSRSDAEALLGLVEGIGPFCRGCYECVSQCRAGLPIPDAVRCLAYLDEYEDVAMASECYATLFPRDEASACLDCGPCAVRCRAGLSVRDLAQRAHLLFGPASSRRETSA